MVNLADIARLSGRGAGLESMSRQFGLDPGLTARTVEALLPAFAMAFQRLALHPAAFADFARAASSGTYAPFFDNPGQSHAATSGMAVVDQLFRSPEASRQVASQAAALTGVAAQVVQQMMPVLAATIMGGVFRFASVEGFAGVLRQWGDALKAASERLDPPKPQDPFSAWQEAAGRMMGIAPPPAPAPKPAGDPAGVLDAWVAMVGAMTGVAAGSEEDASRSLPPPAAREAPEDPPPGDANPFEAMSQMFDTGREVHAQHVAAFRSILDSVWGTGGRA